MTSGGPSIIRALASVASTPAAASLAMMALLTSANVRGFEFGSEALAINFEGLMQGALVDLDAAELGTMDCLGAGFDGWLVAAGAFVEDEEDD